MPSAGEGRGFGFRGARMRGSICRISAIRPAAPAAELTSLQTCESSPSAPAPKTAYSTNWDRRPAEMRSAMTS